DSEPAPDPTPTVIAGLARLGRPPEPIGPGTALAPCPLHPDFGSGLVITRISDGTCALQCRSGWPAPAVLAELGLKLADLFTAKRSVGHHTNGGSVRCPRLSRSPGRSELSTTATPRPRGHLRLHGRAPPPSRTPNRPPSLSAPGAPASRPSIAEMKTPGSVRQ